MNERLRNIIKIIILLFIFFFIGKFFANLFISFGFKYQDFDFKDQGYFEALIEIILSIIVYLFYRKTFNNDYNKYLNNHQGNKKLFLKLFAIFLLIKIISGVVTGLLMIIFGYTNTVSENQNIINLISDSSPFMMLISASIFAPIVEEGIFRLGLKKVFKNKYVFIVVSGLLFGFMHIFPTDLNLTEALIQSVSYVTMGVTLAYMYSENDNIWLNIGIHSLNNFLSMIALIFMA